MELADVFEKIANNARLTPEELQFLKISMRQTQINNSIITGIKTGGADISVATLTAKKIITGNREMNGVFAGLRASQSIPSATATYITSLGVASQDISNGVTVTSDGYIVVPENGRYFITINAKWQFNATGTRDVQVSVPTGSPTTLHRTADTTTETWQKISFESYISSAFRVLVGQDSGSTLLFTGEIFIHRVGSWRWLPT